MEFPPVSETPARRRRYRTVEPIQEEVRELISAAKRLEPSQVQRFVVDLVNARIDEELEALAKWLSEWDPAVETEHVRTLIARGQPRMATNAIIAQMRRETVAEVRRHKRLAADVMVDVAVEVDV